MQEVTKANSVKSGRMRIYVARFVLAITVVLTWFPAHAQPANLSNSAQGTVQGYVRDPTGKPLSDVTLFLQPAIEAQSAAEESLAAHTDSEGAFRFSSPPEGSYNLAAEKDGYRKAVTALAVKPNAPNKIAIVLQPATNSEAATSPSVATRTQKSAYPTPEFFDEPQFTVAGVTQASNSGGHGSDTAVRTTEALAKATATLGNEDPSKVHPTSSPVPSTEESSLRKTLAREPENSEVNRRLGTLLASGGNPAEALPYLQRAIDLNPGNAETHHLLGNVSEKLNRPLDAVREYQRAAELDASEQNLFDWGAELLAHRAFEPATDVFSKGNRLFPKSGRMLVGLGVAWYARGSYDRASQALSRASDLDPFDPSPYLFLGKMQNAETIPSVGSVEQFARFAQVQPGNALANYYYAVSLRKQSLGAAELPASTEIESLLLKALRIDPGLGEAHLQLGILYSQRGDITRSISEYREAVAVGSNSDDALAEAHYRLGQAYVMAGEKAKARGEFELHQQLAKKIQEDTARERRNIQQFVILLRGDNSDSSSKH
jgi:tetratricopeptide (TPR) repeat protein